MRSTFRILAAASLAAATVNSFAAEDGAAGPSSSSGNFLITLNVPPQIVVKNFNDMTITAGDDESDGEDIVGTEDICVGGRGFGKYSVNLSSQNGSTGGGTVDAAPFQLNGNSENLPYNAAFINNSAGNTGTDAESGSGDVPGEFDRAGDLNCVEDNARVFVTVAAANWEVANESSYSDTLTVTVTAE